MAQIRPLIPRPRSARSEKGRQRCSKEATQSPEISKGSDKHGLAPLSFEVPAVPITRDGGVEGEKQALQGGLGHAARTSVIHSWFRINSFRLFGVEGVLSVCL